MVQELVDLEERIISCRKCPRLTAWREKVAITKRKAYLVEDYWGKPVPGFGDHEAKILVIGLAPGAHGSNRTGRMFTGDSSGDILYRNLFQYGFANQPVATHRMDHLQLSGIFISAVCRCVPPGNKPSQDEIVNCLPYLWNEINLLKNLKGVVALGRVAFDGFRKLMADSDQPMPENSFHHGNFLTSCYRNLWLLQSYHPSRQNTQTGRLSETMFASIWARAKELIT